MGSTLDANPVYNYADTAHTVQQVAYSFCGTDTFETEGPLRVPAAGGFVDSTGDLFLAVNSTATKADSVLYLFGDGASSTDLDATTCMPIPARTWYSRLLTTSVAMTPLLRW